ncbi:site-specific integrase [Shimia aestuarii]|uniref:Phage integrase family protein n=1 Tax=Shimia aestuarii TaxID=254406 RepID=A0A1I4HQM5_9RHOB|nr:site-specific integrase [Shimia aestuarii]SFL44549.1 Phage integrase family protein [Shimia aestuarii]
MASYLKVKSGWRALVARQGVRRSRTFPNKTLAQRWAAEEERKIFEGEATQDDASRMSVAELLEKYRQEDSGNWSETKSNMVRRTAELFGDMRVDELTLASIKKVVTTTELYSASTCRVVLQTLAGALRHARIGWGMIVPSEAVKDAQKALEKTGHLSKPEERDRRITPEEEAALVEHWVSNLVPSDVVAFLIDTPIRSGEMCALTRDDIEGGIITIRDRKDPTKRHRIDRVPLVGRSAEIMERRLRGDTLRPFPFSQARVYDAIQSAAAAAGLDDLHVHDLRHEGISRLFAAGWQVPHVALITGHKRWETLKRYTHVTAEEVLAKVRSPS